MRNNLAGEILIGLVATLVIYGFYEPLGALALILVLIHTLWRLRQKTT